MRLANGWYKRGHSEFASAVVAAKQPGKPNTRRVCADYTAVNQCAVEDWYPVKNAQEVTHRLAGNKVYHSIDIRKAYLQLKLTPFASRLLAVTTPCGLWLPTTAPFRFVNLPGAWTWLVSEEVLGELDGNGVEFYIDDLNIHGKDFDSAFGRLRQVFE